jgi:Gas vesicle synthesis protein GvpL/GvpF
MSGLEAWARSRAPELLSRAEAEAVAVLREALLAAATAGRPVGAAQPASPPAPAAPARHSSQPAQAAPAERERKPEGHALWTYCVVRSGESLPSGVQGVDPAAPVEQLEHEGLAALVSRVPLAEFGEEPLRENLNDLAWLERVARTHEAVLEHALERGPVVPLRLCTIYADEARVRAMLTQERAPLRDALERLDGRKEWGVKLLVDGGALAAAARAHSPEVAALEQELGARSGGGAYMIGRRLERCVAEVTARLAGELADDVHARLGDWAGDSVVSPPQNRELSGHEGEMLLNAAYLVEAERTEELRGLLAELEERHRDLGARLELTGPWPPYNFVSRETGAPA